MKPLSCTDYSRLCIITGAVNHYYGEGSGTIHIQDVTCYGSERNITNCTYVNNTVRISHAQDVGVKCRQGQCFCVHTCIYTHLHTQDVLYICQVSTMNIDNYFHVVVWWLCH